MPGDQTSLQRSFYEINTQVPRRALVAWWSGPLGWLPSAPRGPALLFTHQLTLTTERASTPTPLESVLKSPHRDPHEDPVLPMRGQVPPGPRPPSHLFHSQLGGEKLVGSSPAGGKGREVAFCRQAWQEAHRPRDPHTWLLQSSLGSSPPPLTQAYDPPVTPGFGATEEKRGQDNLGLRSWISPAGAGTTGWLAPGKMKGRALPARPQA